jgi:hypothetical protein
MGDSAVCGAEILTGDSAALYCYAPARKFCCFSDESSSASLDTILEALSNRTDGVLHDDLFRGIVLLRRGVFFGPAKIHVAAHGDLLETRLWDNILYEYYAKWTFDNAHTISVVFMV